MELDWNRVLSLIVCLVYLIDSLIWGESEDWLILLCYLVILMGCIWFTKEVGGFTGIGAHGISISTPTPGIVILILGWLLLLMPVIAFGSSVLIPVVE